jgi:hypothetical protein
MHSLAGEWWLTQVNHKNTEEPFQFSWRNDGVSFSYGNGHIMDFSLNGN